MTDDLRLRVANKLDAMILAELAAGKSASEALYVIVDAILPLLELPPWLYLGQDKGAIAPSSTVMVAVKWADWTRFLQAREKFLGEEK